MQVFQPSEGLSEYLLYFIRRDFVGRALDHLQDVAFHEIQTQIDNRRLVIPPLLVHHLFDIQYVGMVQPLKNLYLPNCCYGKPHLIFVLEVLHLLQCIEFFICKITSFIH